MHTAAQKLQALFTLEILPVTWHCPPQYVQPAFPSLPGGKNLLVFLQILLAWANLWISMHKFCTDIYVLASLKETNEPTERRQVDSSVMSYRNNPVFRTLLQQGSAPDVSGSGSLPNILCAVV